MLCLRLALRLPLLSLLLLLPLRVTDELLELHLVHGHLVGELGNGSFRFLLVPGQIRFRCHEFLLMFLFQQKDDKTTHARHGERHSLA